MRLALIIPFLLATTLSARCLRLPRPVIHAATQLTPASRASGLAPRSLFGVHLYELIRAGQIRRDETISLRFRADDEEHFETLPLLRTELTEEGQVYYIESVVPAAAQPGPAELFVAAGAEKVFPFPIFIAPSNFGLFTKSCLGVGSATAWNEDDSGTTLNRLTNPVLPGTYLTLEGTGLGGAGASDMSITIGGIPLRPEYVGPAPDRPGIDLIRVRIPEEPSGIPDGCYVPVVVRIGASVSPGVTISKSNSPGVCNHPLGLSAADLAGLDRDAYVPVGEVYLYSSLSPAGDQSPEAIRQDSVAVYFHWLDAPAVEGVTGSVDRDASVTPCIAYGFVRIVSVLYFAFVLDAGVPTILSGPDGRQWELEGDDGIYWSTVSRQEQPDGSGAGPPSLIKGGEWKLSVAGGRAVPAFETIFPAPPPLRWTNREAANSISRERDLTITWDPAGYTARQSVTVNLETQVPLPADEELGIRYVGVNCIAPASAGSLTVPRAMLSTLPGPAPELRTTFTLTLFQRNDPPLLFQAPRMSADPFPGIVKVNFSELTTVSLK